MIRSDTTSADLEKIDHILKSTKFFYDHEIEIAKSLLEEHQAAGISSPYKFIFLTEAEGYACFGEVPCTVGIYDLYWIAVENTVRNCGLGSLLLRSVEAEVKKLNGRSIYIETSERDLYQPTRDFYLKHGYLITGFYPNFYDQNDGKFIFTKSLV